jgi:hypothetical protein
MSASGRAYAGWGSGQRRIDRAFRGWVMAGALQKRVPKVLESGMNATTRKRGRIFNLFDRDGRSGNYKLPED